MREMILAENVDGRKAALENAASYATK